MAGFQVTTEDEKRRARFLGRLIGIIRRRVRKSFGSAVILDLYRQFDTKYCFHEFCGYPYSLCARSCVADVNRWREHYGYKEPVRLVFEDGAKHQNHFRLMMLRDHNRKPIYAKKDEHLAFQAADLVAWEILKAYNQVASQTIKRFRKSFDALASVPNEWGIYEPHNLERMCKGLNISLRVETKKAG